MRRKFVVMSEFTFELRPESFCIRRLAPDYPLDLRLLDADWVSLTRSGTELSLVAPEHIDIDAGECERGWSCLTIQGTLDLGLIGVLAAVSQTLAAAHVGIFVVSTYDTDHILVRSEDAEAAVTALTRAGHRVVRPKRTP
ncbi:MAG: ACT domain-containing protein [Burkholderiales bacterium]|nr:ACT domain-containing protein [Burkholderiales bacterium]